VNLVERAGVHEVVVVAVLVEILHLPLVQRGALE
jgi:hypothetical protein